MKNTAEFAKRQGRKAPKSVLQHYCISSLRLSRGKHSDYYLFRRRICDYEKEKGVNLMEKCFGHVTGEQVKVFKVSGRSVRMDSKQIGSNIAWYSPVRDCTCHLAQGDE